jgi:putative endonuclease
MARAWPPVTLTTMAASPTPGPTRTIAQQAGDAAEAHVAQALTAAGWAIIARNVHVGRRELDLVAADPGPPASLVVVEVRWRRRRDFGLPEETVDQRKRARIRLAASELIGRGRLPDGALLPRLPLRIDLIVVEPAVEPGQPPRTRHYRAAF